MDPGSVDGPCGGVANLDNALAGGQSITIRSFQAREASEFSPASVPLRLHLHLLNVEQFAHDRVQSRLIWQADVRNPGAHGVATSPHHRATPGSPALKGEQARAEDMTSLTTSP